MSSPGQLLAFMALSYLIIVIPGPSVLFVVGRALAYGRRTAIASADGNEFGMLVLATLVAVGVGPVVQRSESIVTVIRLVGAVFLPGLIFALIALASNSVWGFAASQARQWFGRSPRRLAMVGGSGGPALIGLGVGIVVTGRRH